MQLAKIKLVICEPYRMVNKAKGDAIIRLKLRYAFTAMSRQILLQFMLIFMSDRADISTLYLKRFLPSPPINSLNSAEQTHRSLAFRSRAISQRFSSHEHPMVKYAKIFKTSSPPPPQLIEPTNIKIRKFNSNSDKLHQLQISQSVQLHSKPNQLMRQIMRVSQQEMSELQLSVGGSNRMLSLLQAFFQRRNKNKKIKQPSERKREFTPIHPLSNAETPKQTMIRRIDRQNKSKQRMIQSAIVDKQLQPWQIKDTDFGI